MIAGKRITALAIFLRGCNQSNPSSVSNKINQKKIISNYSSFLSDMGNFEDAFNNAQEALKLKPTKSPLPVPILPKPKNLPFGLVL